MRFGIPAALFCLCVNLGQPAHASDDASIPKVAIDKPHVNIGKVPASSATPVDFLLRNDGDAPLELSVGTISCSCTTVDWRLAVIPPHDRKVLKAVITADNFDSGMATDIVVTTNDRTTPKLELSIRGECKAIVEAGPSQVFLTGLESSSLSAAGNVVFTPGEFGNAKTLGEASFTCEDPVIQMSNSPDAGKLTVHLAINDRLLEGYVRSKLVASGHEPSPWRVEVPITIEIRGRYKFDPSGFFFEEASPKRPATQTVTIKGLGSGMECELLPVSAKLKQSMEVKTAASGEAFSVSVTPKPSLSETIEDFIVIGVRLQGQMVQRIRLPVAYRP